MDSRVITQGHTWIGKRFETPVEQDFDVLMCATSPRVGTIGSAVRSHWWRRKDHLSESIGSLLKCGLGYILCIDIIGLFATKLYKSWFDEDPYAPIEDLEDFEAEFTMIPFGPYLALGAIVGTVFETQLLRVLRTYWHWAAGE